MTYVSRMNLHYAYFWIGTVHINELENISVNMMDYSKAANLHTWSITQYITQSGGYQTQKSITMKKKKQSKVQEVSSKVSVCVFGVISAIGASVVFFVGVKIIASSAYNCALTPLQTSKKSLM